VCHYIVLVGRFRVRVRFSVYIGVSLECRYYVLQSGGRRDFIAVSGDRDGYSMCVNH